MPLTYNDGHRYIWREGKPRVTETLFPVAYIGGRSTGLFGAGVYAYASLERLLSHARDKMYAIDVSDVKFYAPHNLEAVIKFSKELIACFNAKMKRIETTYEEAAKEAYKRGKWVSMYDNVIFSTGDIDFAVARTIESFKQNGWEAATQPINAILMREGFLGVEPDFPEANSNEDGIVVFKERFEKGGKVFKMGEDVDVGFEIKKGDEFVRKCLEDEMSNEIVKYHKEIPYDTSSRFKESIRLSIYFEIARIVKDSKGRDYPSDDDYLRYYELIVTDKEIVDRIVAEAFKACVAKNTKETCDRVKKREVKKITERYE